MEKVVLSGNYFSAGGKRFIAVGVNWVPSIQGMQWPYEWAPESIEADFAAMAGLGINFIRFDLVWSWFEPRPGQYNETAFKQFDAFIDLAHRYNLYLNPALFIGGEVGDAFWDVPWRNGRHPHADPEMLHRQANHIAEFGRRYKDEPAIIAWDLTDEPPYWIVGDSTTDPMASNWTRLLCQSLRETDPGHLIVCGNAAQEIGRGPFRIDNIKDWVDFASVHPYPIYEPFMYVEPLLSTRVTYSAAYETKLCLGGGKPVLMQEFGATSAMYSPERQGKYYRTMMYSALGAGSQGFIAWCATDAHPETQFNRAPYKRNPHETQFGITDFERNPRPHGLEMLSIRKVVDQMDLTGIEPAKEEAAILVPHEWAHGSDYTQYGFPDNTLYQYAPGNILNEANDSEGNAKNQQAWLTTYILCRQAGITAAFPRELANWQDYPLAFCPAPLTNTNSYHLYVPFWQKALPWVEAGGSLYASISAMSALSIPFSTRLFGASIEDRLPWRADITLTFNEAFGAITPGETFTFQAGQGLDYTGALLHLEGARVAARDQDGNPALITFETGRGRTALCAYPIEMMLGITPNALEEGASYWKIYQALKTWAGMSSPFTVDDPAVEVSLLAGAGRAYVVLTNHSAAVKEGLVHIAGQAGQASALGPDGRRSVEVKDGGFPYRLEGFSGVVYEVSGL